MTQTAAPNIGLGAKIYIATTQGTAITVASGTVSGGTLIGGVKKITPPKPTWGTEDVTVLSTPNTGRRKIKTVLDNKEAKIDGLNESADPGQVLLAAAFLAPSNTASGANWSFLVEQPINFAGGQTSIGDYVIFNAMVTEYEVGEADIDKVVPFSATLTIDGPITVTEGS